jgi:hypothetical protein
VVVTGFSLVGGVVLGSVGEGAAGMSSPAAVAVTVVVAVSPSPMVQAVSAVSDRSDRAVATTVVRGERVTGFSRWGRVSGVGQYQG